MSDKLTKELNAYSRAICEKYDGIWSLGYKELELFEDKAKNATKWTYFSYRSDKWDPEDYSEKVKEMAKEGWTHSRTTVYFHPSSVNKKEKFDIEFYK